MNSISVFPTGLSGIYLLPAGGLQFSCDSRNRLFSGVSFGLMGLRWGVKVGHSTTLVLVGDGVKLIPLEPWVRSTSGWWGFTAKSIARLMYGAAIMGSGKPCSGMVKGLVLRLRLGLGFMVGKPVGGRLVWVIRECVEQFPRNLRHGLRRDGWCLILYYHRWSACAPRELLLGWFLENWQCRLARQLFPSSRVQYQPHLHHPQQPPPYPQ